MTATPPPPHPFEIRVEHRFFGLLLHKTAGKIKTLNCRPRVNERWRTWSNCELKSKLQQLMQSMRCNVKEVLWRHSVVVILTATDATAAKTARR